MAVQAASKFQKPTTTATPAATTTAAPVATIPESRYKGAKGRKTNPEFPQVGTYLLEVVSNREEISKKSKNFAFVADLKILEIIDGGDTHRVGEVVRFRVNTSGSGANYGVNDVKSYVMAASGIDDEESYDAFDPEGFFIDLVGGNVHPGNEEYRKRGDSIIGQQVRAKVSKGADRQDGDWYRNWQFSAVEDPAAA